MPTLTCDRTRELFSEALDRDLTPSIEPAFDRHLHTCLRCEAEFARFRIAVGALQSCEPESVPDSFHAALEARVTTLERQPLRRAASLVAAAAAVTLLCFGWPWWQRGTAARHVPALASASDETADLEADPLPPLARTALEPAPPAAPVDERSPAVAPPAVAPPAVAAARPIELKIDTRPLADLLATVWNSLRTPAASASVAAAEPLPVGPEPAAEPVAAPVASVTTSDEDTAPVVVIRSSGYVQIKTSGDPIEVIPALLALVADRDPELRSAAEEHLRLMHDTFMENPQLAAQLTPPPEPSRSRSVAALHDSADSSANPSLQRWEQWWSNNRQLVDR